MATKDKDKDYGPLPPLIAKGLNDKLYEKRKTAALELERSELSFDAWVWRVFISFRSYRTIKELNALGDWKQVDNIAFILNQEFIQIPNANSKKGGLIGLAATAIALGIVFFSLRARRRFYKIIRRLLASRRPESSLRGSSRLFSAVSTTRTVECDTTRARRSTTSPKYRDEPSCPTSLAFSTTSRRSDHHDTRPRTQSHSPAYSHRQHHTF